MEQTRVNPQNPTAARPRAQDPRPATHQQAVFSQILSHLNQRIIGQEKLCNRLLLALLSDGHLLVEGAPGLAKTTAIKALAQCIEGDFHRIQFTPDLLPADLTGTEIFRQQQGTFTFQQGPLFHHFVLADEINRAPAKVQSALLEAMAEGQITVGRQTYALPKLFLVMATQNPIEQEGTYPLPEAQLDRFLMYVSIGYPDAQSEHAILALNHEEALNNASPQATHRAPHATQEIIFAAREEVLNVYLAKNLQDYLVQLVMATRNPKPYGADVERWIRFGASPRGTIGLARSARAHAWLAGRDFVAPQDIHAVALDVLRHRVLLTYEAEAEGITTDHVLNTLLKRLAIP